MWRNHPLLAALAIVAGTLSSGAAVSQPRVRPALGPASYFPLNPGDHWLYERRGPAGQSSTWGVTVGAGAPDAHAAYVTLSGYFPGAPRQVRVGPGQRVVELDFHGGPDALWYLLGATPGTRWRLTLADLPTLGPVPACISGSKLQLADRSEIVRVPAGTFRNVVRIDVGPPCADAGITGEWFAPGVGLVRREETSIAGPVISELVSATVAGRAFPAAGYETSLGLERPLLFNDLMPPVDDDSLPVVRGVFTVTNRTDIPVELVFAGCRSVALTVSDFAGTPIVAATADDGGCCTCDSVVRLVLVRDSFSLPFSFRLATENGEPLPDGRYCVSAVLQTTDPDALRPSAAARIEMQTVY
jgi:hypothetical protein